ncbi:MAG: vanadium-dependent haloperoxidase [Chloroflexi bacterium]|nr:MAG: vanadium-dependent haloperoxidase [Chloroflexota bacterium]
MGELSRVSRRTVLRWGALGLVAPALTPLSRQLLGFASSNDENVVLQWNAALLQAIRTSPPRPPVVARQLAVVQTSMFDAWAAYDADAVGTRLGDRLRRPAIERTLANKSQAISYAAYRTLLDLFPTKVSLFDGLMTTLGYDPRDGSADPATATGIGNLAAQAVLAFRHHDGSNQLGDLHPGAYSDYTAYVPVNTPDQVIDPNRWQPLRVSDGKGGFIVQQYIAPHWGKVIPFSLSAGDQLRPPAPATYHQLGQPSGGYVQQAQQILHYSADLTDTEKMIAEYWADGPSSELPPGHWCLFTHFVSQRDRHDLDQDIKLFFTVANAVFDAGIAAWDAKRAHDSERPVTAVTYLFGEHPVRAWKGPYLGTGEIPGSEWKPYQPATVVTPAFPEYLSGHSTFSAAAAEVLRRFTGSDSFGSSVIIKAGSSKIEPGRTPAADVTLSWSTFTEAADQAGLSRRYGGIHFEQGDLVGRQTGRLVGTLVWTKAQHYITGAGP